MTSRAESFILLQWNYIAIVNDAHHINVNSQKPHSLAFAHARIICCQQAGEFYLPRGLQADTY